MHAQRSFLFAVLAFAFGVNLAIAATRCVPLSHPGSCDQRYATIQAAVDASSAGDVVLVAPGVYAEPVTITGSVTLRGAQAGVDGRSRSGPESILDHPLGPLTIFDCDNNVVVDGFTLSGGVDFGGSWSGVWITSGGGCGADGTFRIENNVIQDNIAGLWIDSGFVTARQNRILNNTATPGLSEAVIANSPARSVLLERNLFEGHLDGSVNVLGPTSVSIVDNQFDRRIRLARASFALVERNVGAGAGSPDALIEIAGGTQGATIFDNVFAPASSGRTIEVSDAAGTGIPSSGLVVSGNCFATPGSVGLQVEPGAYSGTLEATSNWWGAADGPSGAGPGGGAAIAAAAGVVQFMPFRSTSESCGCLIQDEGAPCDDSNACTGPDSCSNGSCAGPATACEDGNACTDDSCDAAAGCVHTINTSPCDDGLGCTTSDVCAAGSCAGMAVNCNDGNACTDDSCVEPAGACQHGPDDANSCTDGNACTTDACVSGTCTSGNAACSDGLVCTTDYCTPTGCVHATSCDDGNSCTDDFCVMPGGSCGHTVDNTNTCSDGNLCTPDACVSGVCVSGSGSCNDGLWCTADHCGLWGCQHVTDGGPCDDGNVCTNDSCNAAACLHTAVPDPNPTGSTQCGAGVNSCARSGYCVGGHCDAQPENCDDGNPCTSDFCRLTGGCVYYSAIQVEEVGNLTFSADKVSIGWPPPVRACQPSYDVASALLTRLPVGSYVAADRCIPVLYPQQLAQDSLTPSVGDAFWYVVRTRYFDQLTGYSPLGSYGTQRIGGVASERQSTNCP